MSKDKLLKKSKHLDLLQSLIGDEGTRFLRFGLESLNRILPHTEALSWSLKLRKKRQKTKVRWQDSSRRAIELAINLSISDFPQKKPKKDLIRPPIYHFFLTTTLKRKAKSVQRTLDLREMDLCSQVTRRISSILGRRRGGVDAESLRAIRNLFEEQVVAAHICHANGINSDLAEVFSCLRELAEQSYENKSLSYGIIFVDEEIQPENGHIFPRDFFEFKRYRAMSDGYKTAFKVSTYGKLLGLCDLHENCPNARQDHFYPEWTQHLAEQSRNDLCSICLTRQGDILVFDRGSLRFTYRSGRWQYWNHRHVIDYLRDRARAQHVSRNLLPNVVRTLYRATLDVSFRRSGGLFVLLRNQRNYRKLVLRGDAIGDSNRDLRHKAFDDSLRICPIFNLSRLLLDEIAALDGAVVVGNHGRLLAYGAVLQPNKRDKFNPSEGSRTKAAITASKFGISIKVSADGDITFYEKGRPFLKL